MSQDFCEGFDKYGAPNVGISSAAVLGLMTVNPGEWSLYQPGGSSIRMDIVGPLSKNGYALKLNGDGSNAQGGWLKTFPASGRVLGMCWFSTGLGTSNQLPGWVYRKGTTLCFSIGVNTNGTIVLHQQDLNGTIIGQSVQAVTAGSTHLLVWDITVGASSNYQVWLDGVSVFSGSTGNTGNGQTTVDTIILGTGANASPGNNVSSWLTYDNMIQWNTGGGANNAVVLTGPVVDTEYSTADSQTQFTFGQGTLGPAECIASGTTGVFMANAISVRKFTPSVNCTLQSVCVFPEQTVSGGNWRGVVYADSAGAPGSLLSGGNQVVGSIQNTLLVMPLTTPQALTAGTPYWIGFMSDSAVNMAMGDGQSNTTYKSNTYTSGPPNPYGTPFSTNNPNPMMFGIVTGIASNNWSAVSQNPPPMPLGSDVSYVSSSTVGNEDLQSFAPLAQTPNNVYSLTVKVMARNTDAGTRTVDIRTNSAGTDTAGTTAGQSPTTAYQWLSSLWETDPHTGSAWTSTNLNAATSGYKIAS